MDNETRARMLRQNAEKFRRLAKTDRPGRDQWNRRAQIATDRANALERGDND